LERVLGHLPVLRPEVLEGFRHDFSSGGYDTLSRDPRARTKGFSFDASQADLMRLKRSETRYQLRAVVLESGRQAWSFFER
jgi:hypothetical protein